jgi:hypothetical protein
MKIALCVAALLLTAGAANAQYYGSNRNNSFGSSGGYGTGSNPNSHYVAPSYNSNTGGYTSGHYQTNPNNTTLDNYGTRGNFNPHNGQTGRRNGF